MKRSIPRYVIIVIGKTRLMQRILVKEVGREFLNNHLIVGLNVTTLGPLKLNY